MKTVFAFIVINLISFKVFCQKQDTVFIYFTNQFNVESLKEYKHSKDPNPSTEYPFHGGMTYNFTLSGTDNATPFEFSIFYSSYVPDGTDVVPGYILADSCYIQNKSWYTTEQLLNMKKSEILATFNKRPSELVIMMLDANYMAAEPYWLTRVYLFHLADE